MPPPDVDSEARSSGNYEPEIPVGGSKSFPPPGAAVLLVRAVLCPRSSDGGTDFSKQSSASGTLGMIPGSQNQIKILQAIKYSLNALSFCSEFLDLATENLD